VSLCKDCQEGIHCCEVSFKLEKGSFAYHRKFKGVGFVEEVRDESFLHDVSWNENNHQVSEEHGLV
jgi:transcription elongation factor GreA-like protein